MFESGTLFFIQLVENRVGSNQIPAAFFIIINNWISPPRFFRLRHLGEMKHHRVFPGWAARINSFLVGTGEVTPRPCVPPLPSFLPAAAAPSPQSPPARSLSFNCRKERAKASHPTVRPTHYGRDGAGADRIFPRRGPFNYCIQDLEIIVFYSPIPILPLTQAMSDCGR